MEPSRLRTAAAALVCLVTLAGSGSAQAIFRTYLSPAGNDANPCTLPQPCRLLPRALAAVDPGGEIWMLDSANYNTTSPVAITKSVTILSIPGVLGSVVGINGTALVVNGAGIEVTLQDLNILSFNGTGDIGVLVQNAANLTIRRCSIFGFKGNDNGVGIWSQTGATATKIAIIGTTVRNNHHGIIIGASARAVITGSQVVHNAGQGIESSHSSGPLFSYTPVVTVSDTVSSNNANGFVASGRMFVTRSVASDNAGTAFLANTGAATFLVVGESVAVNNAIGFENRSTTPCAFSTRFNSTVTGNTADSAGQPFCDAIIF